MRNERPVTAEPAQDEQPRKPSKIAAIASNSQLRLSVVASTVSQDNRASHASAFSPPKKPANVCQSAINNVNSTNGRMGQDQPR